MKILSIHRLKASTRRPVRELSISTLRSIANDHTDNRQAQAKRELERRKKIDQRHDKLDTKKKRDVHLDLLESPLAK